jgi:peroxiredoxin
MSMAISIGGKAPGFDLPGVDGKQYSLASFAGKPAVVVLFWCNHCPYVIMYEERLLALCRDYADRGVGFVAINCNDPATNPGDSFENMMGRAKARGYTFPYLFDEGQQSGRDYGATRTPEVFLLDADRTVAYHGRIDDCADDASAVQRNDLREALDEVLAGRTVAVPDTGPIGCGIKWKAR